MRTTEQILADPMATQEELYRAARFAPVAVLLHANCPSDFWWKTAPNHVFDAMESPAYGLMLLESPERWESIRHRFHREWIGDGLRKLADPIQLRLFGCDCFDHALPPAEDRSEDSELPVQAIEAVREWTQGRAAKENVLALSRQCQDLWNQTFVSVHLLLTCHMAQAAYHIANLDGNAVMDIENACSYSLLWVAKDEPVEKKWQWEYLLSILRKVGKW